MLNLLKITCLCIFLSGCTGFLDWNQDYLYKKNDNEKKSGYVFKGNNNEAKNIADKCKSNSQNFLELEHCLLNNGFEKPKL